MACSGVYLFEFEFAQALGAEFFNGEAAKDRTIDHGSAESCVVRTAATGKIAHKPAGEGVARAGWIVRLFERKGWDAENTAPIHHHGAVFAALHDESLGAEFKNVASGEEKIVFVRELASFRVVDHQDVDLLERFAEVGGSALNPVVHGVERDKLGPTVDLFQDTGLQARGNVGAKNVRRLAKFFRELRIEVGKNVKLGDESLAFVEMLGIFTGPEKAFAGGALETERVDLTAAEDGFLFFGEVVTDDSDEIHMSEETGGNGEICGCAADDAVDLAVRAFDGVECYGTYDEK